MPSDLLQEKKQDFCCPRESLRNMGWFNQPLLYDRIWLDVMVWLLVETSVL